jgi:hypothetical protein
MVSIDLSTTSNLLRYISEWDPREPAHTKGGYMDGSITIPKVPGKLKMVIQTFPAPDIDPFVADIHPCILHVVRIGKGKREQELEPVPTFYHWKQEFEIEDGTVRILNRISPELDVEKDGVTPRQVPLIDDITTVRGNSINLSRKRGDLNLILLQPKQKARAKVNEATVTKVLSDRLGTNCSKKIEAYEEFFKKKNAKNLKRICLKVDFFRENGEPCGSSVSAPIIDTGNKEIGSMDFYDATPHKSCVLGGRKVIMVSEYNLDKNVFPIFQVYDQNDDHHPELDELLIQPHKDEVILKNQTIIFITPKQPSLAQIKSHLENYRIKLLGKRMGDGYTSNKMFNFRYIEHQFKNCPFCDHKVDSDEHVQIEAGIERPKPRQKKRVMHTTRTFSNEKRKRVYSTDEESIASSVFSPGFKLSPTSYHSPTHPLSSPDSGVDSYFSNSDGGHTPERELEYTLGVVAEQGHEVSANEFVNISTGVYAPVPMHQDEFSEMLEISSQDAELIWGHQKTDDAFNEVIEKIDLAQLLETMEEDESTPENNFSLDTQHQPEEVMVLNSTSAPETDFLSNMEEYPAGFAPNFSTTEVMMSQRDPMISHGSMTICNSDVSFKPTVRKHGPVVLEQRICRDSTNSKDITSEGSSVKMLANFSCNSKDMTKPRAEEIISSETKAEVVEERNEKRQVKKTEKIIPEPDSSFLENLPIFVMLFIIFILLLQATMDLSTFAFIVLAMTSALSVVFVKTRF